MSTDMIMHAVVEGNLNVWEKWDFISWNLSLKKAILYNFLNSSKDRHKGIVFCLRGVHVAYQ